MLASFRAHMLSLFALRVQVFFSTAYHIPVLMWGTRAQAKKWPANLWNTLDVSAEFPTSVSREVLATNVCLR